MARVGDKCDRKCGGRYASTKTSCCGGKRLVCSKCGRGPRLSLPVMFRI